MVNITQSDHWQSYLFKIRRAGKYIAGFREISGLEDAQDYTGHEMLCQTLSTGKAGKVIVLKCGELAIDCFPVHEPVVKI